MRTSQAAATAIREELAALADPSYRTFQAKLVPNVEPACIVGVRVPALRKLAKRISGTPAAKAFLADLPHKTYDEDMLHALLVNELRGYEDCLAALQTFLPHVDNWAVCDALAPRPFKRRPVELPEQAHAWMQSGHVYTARFGIGVLMRHYLDEAFDSSYLRWVCAVDAKGEYYLRMMVAWYMATALAKQWDAAVAMVERRALEP